MGKTISEGSKQLNKELHDNRKDFGSLGGTTNIALINTIRYYHKKGVIARSLDYGTGKGTLVNRLRKDVPSLEVCGYDPSVESFEKYPQGTFDFVTCLDVLEHVELEYLHNVLSEITGLCGKFVYFHIDMQPAIKRLSDGRNAHILLAPQEWWIEQISRYFKVTACFPLIHKKGHQQKVCIVAAKSKELSSLLWRITAALDDQKAVAAYGYLESK